MQIIDSRRLSADDNLWLKSLSDELGCLEIKQINTEIALQDKAARITAYCDVIVRANAKIIVVSTTQLEPEKIKALYH
jgi:hypothetical protein